MFDPAEGPALLRAILEDPADDAPRLIYADWLEDCDTQIVCDACAGRGQPPAPKDTASRPASFRIPKCQACGGRGVVGNGTAARAEFIRGQIRGSVPELDFQGGAVFSLDYYPLAAVHDIFMAAPAPHVGWSTSRGFAHSVRLPAAAFAQHAKAIFSSQPIETVLLSDKRPLEWDASLSGTEDELWVWLSEDSNSPSEHTLPRPLYDLLRDDDRPTGYGGGYVSRGRAYKALLPNLLAYGRRLAGLQDHVASESLIVSAPAPLLGN